jgi:hypothetical protein
MGIPAYLVIFDTVEMFLLVIDVCSVRAAIATLAP